MFRAAFRDKDTAGDIGSVDNGDRAGSAFVAIVTCFDRSRNPYGTAKTGVSSNGRVCEYPSLDRRGFMAFDEFDSFTRQKPLLKNILKILKNQCILK